MGQCVDLDDQIGYTRRMSFILQRILITSLLSTFAMAGTPVIRSITIDGNAAVSSREILECLSSRPLLSFSDTMLDADCKTVTAKYRDLGYLGARVWIDTSRDADDVDLRVSVEENIPTVMGEIILEGNIHLPTEEILPLFTLRPGDPMNESVLEADLSSLLGQYEQHGFPLASCALSSMVIRPAERKSIMDITIAIEEGRRMVIDEVRVEGNTETDASVVVRETRISEGELFNPARVNQIQKRLIRLNIFAAVEEPELYFHNEKGGLIIRVQEGNTNTFDGIVGYVPDASSGYVTGMASVSMRNVFGTGRKLAFRWQREDRFSQELELHYQEPWVFALPLNVGGGFLQRQQDTSYVRNALEIKSELMLTDEFSAALKFTSATVIPAARADPTQFPRSSTSSLGGELVLDTRNSVASPSAGARYQTGYDYGRKTQQGPSARLESQVQRFTLDLESFFQVLNGQVVAAALHGREVRSGQLEESDMFRFGGLRTLRGFREGQFLGSRLAWSNLEYRFLVSRESFFSGFIDLGYYSRPSEEIRKTTGAEVFTYGYGIGVQVESGLGLLSVSFALGQRDSFTQGKIHFGIVNDF